MKNMNVTFFERNEYYNGKLLSAKDFEVEQDYYNNKRKLINIFTMGSGILYGLDVINTGDNRQIESVSIKPGVAIDPYGREIVVPEMDNIIIAKLKGIPEEECNSQARYLCIEYDEEGKGDASGEEEGKRYNRKLEKFKMVLEKDPSKLLLGMTESVYNLSEIYRDEKVVIWHKSPIYMETGKAFECTFIVIRNQKNVRIRMAYAVKTEGISRISEKVSFDSIDNLDLSDCEYTYRLFGGNQDGNVVLEDILLYIDDKQALTEPKKIRVISETGANSEKLVRNFDMKKYLDLAKGKKVCIAKVFINNYKTTLGTKIHIDCVENSIFTRHIKSQIEESRNFDTPNENNDIRVEKRTEEVKSACINEFNEIDKTGVIRIPVEKAFKKVYYTDLIEHGLGKGVAVITTGIEEYEDSGISKTAGMDDAIYTGDAGIFNKSDYKSSFNGVSIGVVQYPHKGVFRLGISLQGYDGEKMWIMVRWWARRSESV